MEMLDRNLDSLIALAASMRATGQPWDAIGTAVDRHAETVRRWPDRYPELWRPTFRLVETQLIAEAAIEARTTLRQLLRANQEKSRLAAAGKLLTSGDRSRALDPEPTPEPPNGQCWACARFAKMSDEELRQMGDRIRCEENDEPFEDGAGI
jgi:hypothetical protein